MTKHSDEIIEPKLRELEKWIANRSHRGLSNNFQSDDSSQKPFQSSVPSVATSSTSEMASFLNPSTETLSHQLGEIQKRKTTNQRSSEDIWNGLDEQIRQEILTALSNKNIQIQEGNHPLSSDGYHNLCVDGYEILYECKSTNQVFISHPMNKHGKFFVIGSDLKDSLKHKENSTELEGRLKTANTLGSLFTLARWKRK